MSLAASSRFVPGRSCAGCTMCCKLFQIKELDKPAGVWCRHCQVESGCGIYPERPSVCRDFHCSYLLDAGLGEEWKPAKAKMVLTTELDGRRLMITVDPQRPDAWKREPFYSFLKKRATLSAPQRGQVLVCVGRHMFMVFPDRDVDLGIVGTDELIVTGTQRTPSGIRLEAYTLHKDDPRAQQLGVVSSNSNAPDEI